LQNFLLLDLAENELQNDQYICHYIVLEDIPVPYPVKPSGRSCRQVYRAKIPLT